MTRARSHLLLAVSILLAVAFLTATQAQNPGPSRRANLGYRRGTFLGLLSVQKVQQELQLSDEQIAKIAQLSKKSRAEAREKYAALRNDESRHSYAEIVRLEEHRDDQAREQVGEILSDEQMGRLYQIRLQARGAVYGLNNPWLAQRLKLTSEQEEKAAELACRTQKKVSEAYRTLRNVMRQGQREKFDEALHTVREIRKDGNRQALGLLTVEQKATFEAFKGEAFDF